MFFPLGNYKNKAAEIDRLDNSVVASSTSQKIGGYKVQSGVFGTSEGTIVVSCFPNAQDLRYSGTSGNRFKWMLANWEGSQSWFSLCVATADNIQIGSYTNYPTLLGPSGWKAGQLGVQVRFYNPNVADGLILINSGSIFDFNNPTPLRVAFGVDATSQKYYASVNGETAIVVDEARSGDVDWNGYSWLDKIGSSIQMSLGYSPLRFDEILMSGSYDSFQYYTTPLNQSEMNVLTAQPYGAPQVVLDKQPEVYYRLQQDDKTATLEFENLGTDGTVNNLSTEFQTAGQITSGSVYDAGSNRYRTRVT